MDFLKYLKSAAKSNTSVRTRYLQQYSQNDNALHVFYEGNDDPSFYTNYFEEKNRGKIFYYQAENKKGVYEIHSKINWTAYEKCRSLFFTDKDFSDILIEKYAVDSNIFVTKYYSIENYLVCKPIFKRVLRDILHIDDEKFIDSCYKNFEKNLKLYTLQMQSIIAWIIYHRSIKSKLQLNDFKISDIFHFDNLLNIKRKRKCKGKSLQEYLLAKTNITHTDQCWKGILKYYKVIKKIPVHKLYLRGKYEIWFLIAYTNKLVEIINSKKVTGEPKIRVKFNLNADNAVELLAPRLKKPTDLAKFLNRNNQ